MRLLGAPSPVLQHPVRIGPDAYWLDFAWPKLKKFGEFDGVAKYFDPGMTGGRPLDEILVSQQRRQAAIERATGWTCVRWTNVELSNMDAFARFLRRSRILP
ncbi:hypothetical protein HII28_18495 [Planctomonas sp. JC2975]|uniref:hypothetical protein n=1 Tax=Planctomonas sp. JC2975 TaxID=2729626 RepID=UPI001473E2BE|nr:hypothetical protein [Planctomonas sp. JC2975]NNC13855.1 hypothetical protein [Planctomonas sp. JC2975]